MSLSTIHGNNQWFLLNNMSHLSSFWVLQSYSALDHVHLTNLQEKVGGLVLFGFFWICKHRQTCAQHPILFSNIQFVLVNKQVKRKTSFILHLWDTESKYRVFFYHRTYTKNDLLVHQNSLYLEKKQLSSY